MRVIWVGERGVRGCGSNGWMRGVYERKGCESVCVCHKSREERGLTTQRKPI